MAVQTYTWKIALPVFLLLLLLAWLVNQSTLAYLAGLWDFGHPGNYTHGYLVLAISAWLIVERRQQLQRTAPCISPVAMLAVAAAVVLDWLALLVDVQMMQTVALLLLTVSVTWFALGWQVTRQVLFPLLFIIYALPVWFPLSPLLQQVTAEVSFWLTRLLDVPAFLDNNIIVLPAGRMSVEEACAGLNYLLAALTLGTLYAWLNYSRLRTRLLIVLIAGLAAVISNILRVTIVVYLGYISSMQHPMVEDHLSLGWILFAAVMVVLLLLDYWLRGRGGELPEQPDIPEQPTCSLGKGNIFGAIGVMVMILLPQALAVLQQPGPVVSMRLQLPAQIGQWRAVAQSDDWQPDYPGSVSASRVYQRDNRRITLYSGYYPEQRQGQELINDLNRISNETVWRKSGPQPVEYAINGVTVLEQQLQNRQGEQRRVWYWYEVAGQRTTSRYMAKLLQIPAMLQPEKMARVVAIADWPQDDAEASRRRLEEFMGKLVLPERPIVTTTADRVP